MVKVYFLHQYALIDSSVQEIVEEIKNIFPDKIFFVCEGEVDGNSVFRDLIPYITPWLEETNKQVNVLIPNPEARKYNNNVITSACCGLDIRNSNWLKHSTNPTFNLEECDRLFTCYNNNAHFHRYVLIDYLKLNNFIEKGYVTFVLPNQNFSFKDYKLQSYNFEKYTDEPDFSLNLPNRPEFTANNIPKNYLKGFIDIVSESRYLNDEFFVTEKTARPVSMLKPFLVSSSQYFHRYLTERYDLELYTEIFDYSFDDEFNLEDRIKGIIKNLSNAEYIFKDKNKLKKIYDTLLPKLISNKQKLIDIVNHKDKMLPKCFDFMNENIEYKIYGDIKHLEFLKLLYDNKWIPHL